MKIRLTMSVLVMIVALGITSCAGGNRSQVESASPTDVQTSSTEPPASPITPTGGSSFGICDFHVHGSPARPVDAPENGPAETTGTAQFTLQMSGGDVILNLDRSIAPCAVKSFESLVIQQYFDNTKCHRLVDNGIFVLQCGDPTATGAGGPGYDFADELPKSEQPYMIYPRGVVAMANAGPDTNGSQFFIVYRDSPLEPHYTIMGTVEESTMQVIDDIANQGVDAEQPPAPIADATIKAVTAG